MGCLADRGCGWACSRSFHLPKFTISQSLLLHWEGTRAGRGQYFSTVFLHMEIIESAKEKLLCISVHASGLTITCLVSQSEVTPLRKNSQRPIRAKSISDNFIQFSSVACRPICTRAGTPGFFCLHNLQFTKFMFITVSESPKPSCHPFFSFPGGLFKWVVLCIKCCYWSISLPSAQWIVTDFLDDC